MYRIISNICIVFFVAVLIKVIITPGFAEELKVKSFDIFMSKKASNTPSLSLTESDKTDSEKNGTGSSSNKENSNSALIDISFSSKSIIDATNVERDRLGLQPLVADEKLIASAKLKTNDMIKKQYFEHQSPEGEGVSDLGAKVDYKYIILGENLALGNFSNAEEIVKAWMKSPGHRANILNTNYEEMGAYAAIATYQGREVWFAVQHFGTERSACPAINSSLKRDIDKLNASLKSKQVHIANEKALLETPGRSGNEGYKEQVGEFNKLVSEYNIDLVISQEKIKRYNSQVVDFNTCLAKYQAK